VAARLQSARDNPSVAFVHVTVIDGTGAAARSDQTVVTSGDRIIAAGRSRSVRIPPGARVMDATGRFLIPGLWDAHIHTRYEGIDHFRLLIANGITSARNMSAPWDYLPEILAVREQIAKGNRVGPRLLTAGPVFDGPGARRATSVVINNADEARQAVRRVKREGADFVKVYDLLSRESFFAIAAEARVQALPLVGHLPYAVNAEQASDAGLRSIEHMDGILWAASNREDEIRRLSQETHSNLGSPTTGLRLSAASPRPVSAAFLRASFNAAKLRAVADHLKKNQTIVVPTLSNYWSRFENRSEHSVVADADRLRYVPAGYADFWQGLRALPRGDEEARLLFEQSLIAVRELHAAGVTILPGTDVGVPFQVPGFSLHDELSLLVKAGLSEMAALQAATRNPARVFNLSDQGTIEPGMRADLVLLDANPLEDIENTGKIRTVVAGGRVFERSELDQMLADVERAAGAWAGTPTR
jgi:imidazolonepropionase-like amidohydrolase